MRTVLIHDVINAFAADLQNNGKKTIVDNRVRRKHLDLIE